MDIWTIFFILNAAGLLWIAVTKIPGLPAPIPAILQVLILVALAVCFLDMAGITHIGFPTHRVTIN